MPRNFWKKITPFLCTICDPVTLVRKYSIFWH
jgi:hypothetical protein